MQLLPPHLLRHCQTDQLCVSRESVNKFPSLVLVKEGCVLLDDGTKQLPPESSSDVLATDPHQVNSTKVAQTSK